MLRPLMLAGRGLLLVAFGLAILPACSGDGTGASGAQTGILWNASSTGSTSGGAPSGSGLLWVDPNSGLGGGIMTGNIRSVDSITYSSPTVYIPDNMHPLSTASSDQTVNQAENGLMQAVNGYRSRILGGIGGGNGGGLGGIGGGATLPGNNVFLPSTEGLIGNARANCKHFALFHAGPMALASPEGDTVNGGGVAPPGRLAKTGITATAAVEFVVSGPAFPDFTSVTNELTANYGDVITQTRWTHLGAGYWRGGSEQHYWSLILAQNPRP